MVGTERTAALIVKCDLNQDMWRQLSSTYMIIRFINSSISVVCSLVG